MSVQKRKIIIRIININLAKCPNLEIDGQPGPGVITLAFLARTTGDTNNNLYFFKLLKKLDCFHICFL